RADPDVAALRVDRDDVARLRAAAAETAALADREAVDAAVPAELDAGLVDDPTRPAPRRVEAPLDEIGIGFADDEADVLALGLVRDRELERARERADGGLVEVAEREERRRELGLVEREE